MNILGFSNEHDAGIAFVRSGRMIYAANEERFSRVKYSEEPIVCTPEDALRAFRDGGLDVLVMESFVTEQEMQR